jgi:hypothetical protein
MPSSCQTRSANGSRRAGSGTHRVDWPTLRETIDLYDLATRLLGPAPGRRGGQRRRSWWLCPLHADKNPSLAVDPAKRTWCCYGCGERGDAVTLVMKVRRCSFPEALAHLTGIDGRTTASKAPTSPAMRSAPSVPAGPSGMAEPAAVALVGDAAGRLSTPAGAQALEYLRGRGLKDETIRAARLGWVGPGVAGIPWRAPGVVIAWHDDADRLALVKVRPPDAWRERFSAENRPPKYIEVFRLPVRVTVYPGFRVVRPGRPLIVTEGELDALLLGQELGDGAAVLTLGSAGARPEPAVLSRLLPAHPWFIATDNDGAGESAAGRWPEDARRVRPPGTLKDWTEVRQAGANLNRWWDGILSGIEHSPLFTWDELATWRWGPAVGDTTPGIVIESSTHPALFKISEKGIA